MIINHRSSSWLSVILDHVCERFSALHLTVSLSTSTTAQDLQDFSRLIKSCMTSQLPYKVRAHVKAFTPSRAAYTFIL